MSGIQRSPFYKEDGDFVFQLGSTLYKVEADTFFTQSRMLRIAIDSSVPNVGSSDNNPLELNGEIIEQDDFDALIEFYYDPATADTREKCLSILSVCLTLDLPKTEATVQAILETIDSSSAPAANMKVDKLLAKYQERLRVLNDICAGSMEALTPKRRKRPDDFFSKFLRDRAERHSESRDDAEIFGT